MPTPTTRLTQDMSSQSPFVESLIFVPCRFLLRSHCPESCWANPAGVVEITLMETFPASVPSDSDISQISTEGKGGIKETVDSLPLFLSSYLASVCFIIVHLCNFKNGFQTNRNKRSKTTEQDELQGPFQSQPSQVRHTKGLFCKLSRQPPLCDKKLKMPQVPSFPFSS